MTLRRSSTSHDPISDLSALSWKEYPELRNGIEPYLVSDEHGEYYIGLRDQYELSPQQLFISQDLFYLLQFFDGKNSLIDIRALYMKKYNKFLFENRIQELIDMLDKSCLLNNPHAIKQLDLVRQEYRQLDIRQPVCAGSSYPAEKEALASFLDKIMLTVDPATIAMPEHKQIKAVIAPHIDIRLGAKTWAHTYSHLFNVPHIDLFVILGIGHYGIENLFALTEKNFQTPDGLVYTDTQLVNDIIKRCKNDFMAEELVHRDEHSIELQTVFLNHYFQNFKILPVLCSFSSQFYNDPALVEIFADFIQSVKTALSAFKGTICYLASVDLAHVGLKYGDPSQPDKVYLAHVEQRDRDILNALATQNRTEFQQIFTQTHDLYHICGYSALTTLLELMPPAKGNLLDYRSAVMDDKNSTVTFASMIFV